MQFLFLLLIFCNVSFLYSGLPAFSQERADISSFSSQFIRDMETVKGFLDDKQSVPLDALLGLIDPKDRKKINLFPLLEETEIKGVKRNWSLAGLAVDVDCLSALKVLQRHGVNIHEPIVGLSSSERMINWTSPLALAITRENRSMIEFLYKELKCRPSFFLDYYPWVALSGKKLYRPLAYAVKFNKQKSVETLLRLGEKFSTPGVQYVNPCKMQRKKSTSEFFFNTIRHVPVEDGFMLSEDEEEEDKGKANRRRTICLEAAVQQYHDTFLDGSARV